MVIQHNLPAMNSHRLLGINNAGTAKNLEKLSSGYKVNRAADDAAGLAISEKMRGQIRGLAMAEQNTQNGISLIQTAEGGLNETHSILQRMRELAVQAANGTYQDEDRDQITLEFENLKSEITRIAESTHYNGIKLLDGSLGKDAVGAAAAVTSNQAAAIDLAMFGATFSGGTAPLTNPAEVTFSLDPKGNLSVSSNTTGVTAKIINGQLEISETATAGATWKSGALDIDRIKNVLNSVDGGKLVLNVDDAATPVMTVTTIPDTFVSASHSGLAQLGLDVQFDAGTAGYGKLDISLEQASNGMYLLTVNGSQQRISLADLNGSGITLQGVTITSDATDQGNANELFYRAMTNGGISISNLQVKDNGAAATSLALDWSSARVESGAGLIFQIGANGGVDQRVGLNVNNMDAFSIGMRVGDKWSDGTVLTQDVMLNDAHIFDRDQANDAIEIITAATNMVSAQRANLGALQNRLEHTLNNLGVTKENLTAAESSIRDVDMAKEMMEFTKNNILVQASQAMLAQANQLPQGVLQLLR